MKSVVRWAIHHSPAMNTIMIAALLIGVASLLSLRREVFPEFDLEIILVTVPYPGASPEEVEDGICQKVEEAVRSIDGIKKQTSVAKEGSGSVVLELKTGINPKKVLAEVRSEVDRIPSFPLLAEDHEVKQLTIRDAVIQVGVLGPDVDDPESERQLRDLTELVRNDLIQLSNVSQAEITGAKEYQIDVEISEETLRQYGLSLQSVADILRRENMELPGGTIRTDAQEVLVKGDNKRITGDEIARLPLISQPNGAQLTVGDLGRVRDGFADSTAQTRIEDRPAMVVSVNNSSSEDILATTGDVLNYVEETTLPPGFDLVTWADRSVDVKDRIRLLGTNGMQGLLLVLFVLAIFLNQRVAFWVAIGIPISILGACAVLWGTGETLNMLSMFAFLMALGIVVDDAIVVGENIFAHRTMGKSPLQAAIDGTYEVLPSVATSVTTTVIAFLPLMFVSGVMGKFIACMPLAMIAMLAISLLESMFILPCHLAHGEHDKEADQRPWYVRAVVASWRVCMTPVHGLEKVTGPVNRWSNHALDIAAERVYLPVLRFTIDNRWVVISGAFALLLVSVSLVKGGHVPFSIMPKLDSNNLDAVLTYPDGTPSKITAQGVAVLEESIRRLDEKLEREGRGRVLKLTRQSVGYAQAAGGPGQTSQLSGSHIGGLSVELLDTTERNVKSDEIILLWRQLAQELGRGFAGAESVSFKTAVAGPGGIPIEFKMLAGSEHFDELEAAVEEVKAKLATYPGVFDIDDDSRPGKWEFKLRVKENAVAMGVPLRDIAETVRASYYGEEAMRLQRGRHEIKLMVRYPKEDRRSLADFDQIRVRSEDGIERPLSELAVVDFHRGLSEINRVDQQRSITVSADVDESLANARQIVGDLRRPLPLVDGKADVVTMETILEKYPNVRVRWEGQQEQTKESLFSLAVGFTIALVGMFMVLTIEFRSYFQPLLVLLIIPFGAIGAIWGHYLRDMPLSLFSMFGLVALAGVVVNDSIVLIDFINRKLSEGLPLREALLEAGRRRLRPVLLTSLTTIAGLLPLLLETSFQAQILIPMATSLAFGLMLATGLVLVLVPAFYAVYAHMCGMEQNSPSGDKDLGDDDIDPADEPEGDEEEIELVVPVSDMSWRTA